MPSQWDSAACSILSPTGGSHAATTVRALRRNRSNRTRLERRRFVNDILIAPTAREIGATAANCTLLGMKTTSARANLRWGLTNGALFGVVFSALIAILGLLRGSAHWDAYSLELWQIILVYFAGCISAGAIVGLLRPLTKHRVGAMGVGAVAGVPVAIILQIAAGGDGGPTRGIDWFFVLFFAVVLGPIGGLIRWQQTRARREGSD